MRRAPGSTNNSVTVEVVDDTGLPVTALNAASFPAAEYQRLNEAAVSISLIDLAAIGSAFSAGGIFEIGLGRYRLDVADAAFATATGQLTIMGETTNKRIICPPIEVAYAPANAVQIGGTAAASATIGTVGTVTNGVSLAANQHVIVDSGTVTNLTNAPTAGDFTSAMKTSLDAATPAVTVSDKTGFALTSGERSAIATAILTDTTASDFATAGSLGHIIVTQLGGAFTSTSSSVFTTAALANGPSGGGGGGDQWATAEPGSYAAGTFGYLVANALTSTTSWIFPAASYTAPAVPAAISQARAIGNEPYTKTFTQNDLRTGIGDQLIDAQTGSPINLTGSTAAFRMISQTDKSVKINDVSATFTDVPNGKVAYSWTGTDLDTPGLYWGWWIVTTGGKSEHFPGDGEKMTVKVVAAE